MSELEDILEKKDSKQPMKKDFFTVDYKYRDEVLEFVYKHGLKIQEARFEKKYICPDGIHSGVDYSQVSPDIYLLETKHGQLKIKHSWAGSWNMLEIEYFYGLPEAKQEIQRLFHAEKERAVK